MKLLATLSLFFALIAGELTPKNDTGAFVDPADAAKCMAGYVPRFESAVNGYPPLIVSDILHHYALNYCGSNNVDEWGTGPFKSTSNPHCPCDSNHNWCPQTIGSNVKCMGYAATVESFSYGHVTVSPYPSYTYLEYFDNGLTVSQQASFAQAVKYSNSYSWSVTNTMEENIGISVEADIPEVLKVHDSFEFKFGLSTTSEQSASKEIEYNVGQTFTIPPRTTAKLQAVVSKSHFSAPYTVKVRFSGAAEIWCGKRVNGHYCWLFYPFAILPPSVAPNCQAAGSDAICTFTGVFTGIQGVSVDASATPCHYGVHC